MSPETIATIVGVVAMLIAGYSMWKAHQAGTPITLTGVTSTLEASVPLAQELTEVALTAAQAAEQLYRTGKLAKSERLDHAFRYVKKWFPDLDQARIITAIEAGVFVVNSIVDSMPDKSVPDSDWLDDKGMTTKP